MVSLVLFCVIYAEWRNKYFKICSQKSDRILKFQLDRICKICVLSYLCMCKLDFMWHHLTEVLKSLGENNTQREKLVVDL